MNSDSRRLMYIPVTGEFITEIFKDGNEIRVDVTDGIPSDSEFRRIEYDPAIDGYRLIVWSAEFATVPEAAPVPEKVVEFTDLGNGLTPK